MSRLGLKFAQLFGRKLPAFRTLKEARSELFDARDAQIAKLKAVAAKSDMFQPDDTPESLKKMEAWYFQLVEADSFRELGVPREDFEKLMRTYFFQVAVVNCADAEWHVSEYAFEPGKYEIGVKRGLVHLMRGSFVDHYRKSSNQRRTAIFREYQSYFANR